jgi:hypothetical protein
VEKNMEDQPPRAAAPVGLQLSIPTWEAAACNSIVMSAADSIKAKK